MKKTTAINYLTPQLIGEIIQQAIDTSEKDLIEALKALLIHHVELVTSGDCGCWDAEGEASVIAARAALERRGIK